MVRPEAVRSSLARCSTIFNRRRMPLVSDGNPDVDGKARMAWLAVLAGLLVLCVPTFYGLAAWLWQQDEQAHGPLILALICWLVWRERAGLFCVPVRTAPAPGFALLILGLLLYVVGRSQEIILFELGSLMPVLAGVVLIMCGWRGLRVFWFPILFVAFMVPLPGVFIDTLTGPLKEHVSKLAVQILYSAGYPIARNGVEITIGQYQLLVADACSGLNSMFSLSALGALFMYLMGRTSLMHVAFMLASILPIAFAANVVRVILLILITFHFGDEAGQGFLHGAAGVVLLMVALLILFLVDAILARVVERRKPA
jgi:exosortase B